jgi:hypothetical protein
MKQESLAKKFGVPESLVDYISNTLKEETAYQAKVKAHMAKKGIKSLGDLSPEEKKKFFNDLDAAHKAKNEEAIAESDLPSTKEKQKTVMVKHKTSGKELKIQASAVDKYKGMGYEVMKEEVEEIEEAESHQSKTTMKHISKPTAGEKKAAKDIKPGVAGYRDRVAMLKSAQARGALKKEEVEQTDEAVVKGKGYDNPDNERKGPEGKVPMTSLMPGHNDKAARLAAVQAKGKLVKGKAQSAPQKEDYELTQEDLDFINSLNEKK